MIDKRDVKISVFDQFRSKKSAEPDVQLDIDKVCYEDIPERHPRGAATLPLRSLTGPIYFPAQRRSWTEIDPDLRRIISDLVKGLSPWPLLLNGSTGVGKSCAALCVLDRADGLYYTATELCENLMQAQRGHLKQRHVEGDGLTIHPDDFWRKIREVPLVVIDEIGCRERVTDFAFETVKRVLDERCGRPLVCISNLGLERLAAVYDDRVASRLAAGTVVCLEGQDRRLIRSPVLRVAKETA